MLGRPLGHRRLVARDQNTPCLNLFLNLIWSLEQEASVALAAVLGARDSERCVCRDDDVSATHVEIVNDAMAFGVCAPDCGDLV